VSDRDIWPWYVALLAGDQQVVCRRSGKSLRGDAARELALNRVINLRRALVRLWSAHPHDLALSVFIGRHASDY
jgi:hypothetical protein